MEVCEISVAPGWLRADAQHRKRNDLYRAFGGSEREAIASGAIIDHGRRLERIVNMSQ